MSLLSSPSDSTVPPSCCFLRWNISIQIVRSSLCCDPHVFRAPRDSEFKRYFRCKPSPERWSLTTFHQRQPCDEPFVTIWTPFLHQHACIYTHMHIQTAWNLNGKGQRLQTFSNFSQLTPVNQTRIKSMVLLKYKANINRKVVGCNIKALKGEPIFILSVHLTILIVATVRALSTLIFVASRSYQPS